MVDAYDAALEDGEEVFSRVGMNEPTEPHILFGGVIDRLMFANSAPILG